MDTNLTDVRIQVGVLQSQVNTLTTQVKTQELVIQDLVAMINKGKGSLWVILTLGGLLGALVSNWKSFIGAVVK